MIERADIPDQAADDTIESLHSKVMADLTLGGYAMMCNRFGLSLNLLRLTSQQALIGCEFEIRYRTDVDDLTQ